MGYIRKALEKGFLEMYGLGPLLLTGWVFFACSSPPLLQHMGI